jgi:ribosomal protein S18 acetylase RimI-like enzyme
MHATPSPKKSVQREAVKSAQSVYKLFRRPSSVVRRLSSLCFILPPSAFILSLCGTIPLLTDLTIQPAGWRDLRGVWALEKACFGPDAWSLMDLVLALFGPGVRLKAVAGDQLVGFVMGEPKPAERFAWIATIGVHPDYQRRGIATLLLTEVEARLTTPTIKLTVRQSNAGAIALYRKFGYTPVGRWERYYASGEAGVVMEKRRA